MRVTELPWSGDKMIVQTLGSRVPEKHGRERVDAQTTS